MCIGNSGVMMSIPDTLMLHVTYCVSASDARALTQMDTKTAGTPTMNREDGVIVHLHLYVQISSLVCSCDAYPTR